MIRAFLFLMVAGFAAMGGHAAMAQPRLPRGISDIQLGTAAPRAYKKISGSLNPERFLVPLPQARMGAKDLLGPDWQQAIEGGWFSSSNAKVAEIGLTFEALDFRLAKTELTQKYGPGTEKIVSGQGLCNDVRVAEWQGSDAWLLLAVTARSAKPGGRSFSQLVLRSPSLYWELKKNKDLAGKPIDAECNWQQW